MTPWIACFLFLGSLGAVLAAPASGVKNAAPPVAAPVPDTLLAMLGDYRRYAETLWHTDPAHPGGGYWGTGRGNGGNEGARAVSITAVVYALLAQQGDRKFSTADRVGPALRPIAETHVTGTHGGTDGKRWGRSWQSAMWAGNMGVAAWIARDTLDPGTMAAVKRVVADEAQPELEYTFTGGGSSFAAARAARPRKPVC